MYKPMKLVLKVDTFLFLPEPRLTLHIVRGVSLKQPFLLT